MSTTTSSPLSVGVVIVEDDEGLRRSIATMISKDNGIRCLGGFPSAEEAITGIPMLRPDVVLMDINLPGMNGVECVAALKRELPELHIVMLTCHDDLVFEALTAGACGFLLKPVRGKELIDAVKEVNAGGSPMTPNIARRVVQTFQKTKPDPFGELSPREREVLELLAKGFLQKEIAEHLGISYWTVQTYTSGIYEKLHVHSRSQAVAKYFER